jgi:hypothetical protein
VEIVSNGASLLVLAGTGEVWQSTDAGSTWLTIGTLSQVRMSGLVLGIDGALYAATREGEVAASPDGANWTWIGTINQLNVIALATDLPVTGVPGDDGGFVRFTLGAPWPNPMDGRTGRVTFPLILTRGGSVGVDLIDINGERVAFRAPERLSTPGRYDLTWDLRAIAAGVYFARLTLDGEMQSRKLTVME